MRVGIDGKPLLPPRTGVYRYTAGLLRGLEALAPEGLEVVVVKPQRPRRTLPWVLWTLQRQTSKDFSVFHCPFYYPPLVPSCPVTVAIHDVLVLTHPHWFPRAWGNTLRWLIPLGARRAAAVIAGSRWVAEEIATICRIPRQHIRVVPYGVDHGLFFPPSQERKRRCSEIFGLHRPYLLMAGALEPRRGVETVLRAMEGLHRRYPELELVLVGNERAPVTALASPPPWVRRLGFVEDSWLPPLYAGAEAVVAASLGEGFDLPVLEALACGAVVVASDIPVHQEIFTGAVRFFPAGDPEGLASVLEEVLEALPLRASLRQAGIVLARAFTWERAAQEHWELWQELVCKQRQ